MYSYDIEYEELKIIHHLYTSTHVSSWFSKGKTENSTIPSPWLIGGFRGVRCIVLRCAQRDVDDAIWVKVFPWLGDKVSRRLPQSNLTCVNIDSWTKMNSSLPWMLTTQRRADWLGTSLGLLDPAMSSTEGCVTFLDTLTNLDRNTGYEGGITWFQCSRTELLCVVRRTDKQAVAAEEAVVREPQHVRVSKATGQGGLQLWYSSAVRNSWHRCCSDCSRTPSIMGKRLIYGSSLKSNPLPKLHSQNILTILALLS